MSDVCALCIGTKSQILKNFTKEMTSVSIHPQNIRFPTIEIFKVFKGISPQIVKAIFQFRDAVPYQLRKLRDFQIPSVDSVFSGTGNIKFLGPKIWEILPHEIKQLENLKEFKKAIRQWKPTSCTCRLCKTHIHRLCLYLM